MCCHLNEISLFSWRLHLFRQAAGTAGPCEGAVGSPAQHLQNPARWLRKSLGRLPNICLRLLCRAQARGKAGGVNIVEQMSSNVSLLVHGSRGARAACLSAPAIDHLALPFMQATLGDDGGDVKGRWTLQGLPDAPWPNLLLLCWQTGARRTGQAPTFLRKIGSACWQAFSAELKAPCTHPVDYLACKAYLLCITRGINKRRTCMPDEFQQYKSHSNIIIQISKTKHGEQQRYFKDPFETGLDNILTRFGTLFNPFSSCKHVR